MALKIGTSAADDGMTKDIYDALFETLKGDFYDNPSPEVCASWKKIAFAVAQGVITHLESNLEIEQVKTGGNVNASVAGSTAAGGADSHTHAVSLSAVQNNLKLSQTADGIGRVKK